MFVFLVIQRTKPLSLDSVLRPWFCLCLTNFKHKQEVCDYWAYSIVDSTRGFGPRDEGSIPSRPITLEILVFYFLEILVKFNKSAF